MTVLDTLNFVAFNPLQNNNPIAVRRRKLMAKIDEQIQLATNKDYTPTQHKWVTDDEGKQTKAEVAKPVYVKASRAISADLTVDTSLKI